MDNLFLTNSLIKWIFAYKNTDAIIYFKKEFNIDEDIKSAQLFIAGYGYYQAYINDKVVDEYFFKPNVSDYKKRKDSRLNVPNQYFSYYDTIDVTKLLVKGHNLLHVEVASGYYHNSDKNDCPNYVYGKQCLRYLLQIKLVNGKEILIYSDSSTLVAVSKHESRLFFGDTVHFDKTEYVYNESHIIDPKLNLVPNRVAYDKVQKELSAVSLKDTPNKYVLDFGVNHSGCLDLFIQGEVKQKITIKYSEFLNEDGSLNFLSGAYADIHKGEVWPNDDIKRKNMYPVMQINTYYLSGSKDHITPLFSWHTYRYVEISSNKPFTISDIRSLFIHHDIKTISTFKCSNEIFNSIYDAYMQTQKCNMHSGLLTDCPHREKAQYLGDLQVVSDTLLRNFAATDLLDKILDDIIASQNINGKIPNTVPDLAGGGGNFWGYAVVQIPQVLYKYTGDIKYYEKAYPSIYRWIIYLLKSRDNRGIISSNGNRWFLGDWLAPSAVRSDSEYVNTICLVMAMDNFFKISEVLNKQVDPMLLTVFNNVKDSINKIYFNEDSYSYSKNIQGETMLAIKAKIVPNQFLEKVNRTFLDKYEKEDAHIDTGFVLTPYLFELLVKYNAFDAAYNLLNKTDYPSFYYMLKGETTFPEHWSKKWVPYKLKEDDEEFIVEPISDTSHCHPMYGAIASWIEEHVGGISLNHINKKEILIAPKYIDKVRFAQSSYKDIYFSYDSSNQLKMKLNVPDGYKAIIDVANHNGKSFIVVNKNNNETYKMNVLIELKEGSYIIEEEKE